MIAVRLGRALHFGIIGKASHPRVKGCKSPASTSQRVEKRLPILFQLRSERDRSSWPHLLR